MSAPVDTQALAEAPGKLAAGFSVARTPDLLGGDAGLAAEAGPRFADHEADPTAEDADECVHPALDHDAQTPLLEGDGVGDDRAPRRAADGGAGIAQHQAHRQLDVGPHHVRVRERRRVGRAVHDAVQRVVSAAADGQPWEAWCWADADGGSGSFSTLGF